MIRRIVCAFLLFCAAFIAAQDDLYLPYDATDLTEDQQKSNPEYVAYPLSMQDKMMAAHCVLHVSGLGPFSVSEDRKVMFSKGNLQYKASAGQWRFAQHQWDYVGYATVGNVYEGGIKSDNTKVSQSYDGWIDLFCWGTSGWVSGANEYQPYSTSTSDADFYPGESQETDLTNDYRRADWGVYNEIEVYPADIWRTMTRAEWAYLLGSRPRARELFAFGSVGGVNGLIILPDDFVLPEGLTFTPSVTKGLTWQNATYSYYINPNAQNYTHNTYTVEQWEQMQEANAVFLPAAGYRIGKMVTLIADYGFYWSVTHNGPDSNFFLYFSNSGLYPQEYNHRYIARSVRLVYDLKQNP